MERSDKIWAVSDGLYMNRNLGATARLKGAVVLGSTKNKATTALKSASSGTWCGVYFCGAEIGRAHV